MQVQDQPNYQSVQKKGNLPLGVVSYPQEQEMGNMYFAMIIVYDLICYGLLSVREGIFTREGGYQNIIFHYGVVWILFTDLLVVNLAKNKRYWYNVFRCVQGVQIAWMTCAFWIDGLDSKYQWLTIARVAAWGVRFLWGALDTYRYGPWLDHWLCFVHESRQRHKTMFKYQYLVYGHLVFVAILFVLPHLFNFTMWTYGESKIDAPIVGCLATHAFSVFVKWFTLETQAVGKGAKAFTSLVMVLLFLVQWILTTDVYFHATIPYVHCAGELYFTSMTISYFYDWMQDSKQ